MVRNLKLLIIYPMLMFKFFLGIISETHIRMRQPQHTRPFAGSTLVRDILDGHPRRAYNVFRMEPHVFRGLAALLESRSLLRSSRTVSVEEQLAIFMTVVGHAAPNRVACEQFQHSSETISRYFHMVLCAINSLANEMIQLPGGDEPAHPRVRNTPFMVTRVCVVYLNLCVTT